MTHPVNPTPEDIAALLEELRTIGCHANGDARCTCGIGQNAADLIQYLMTERDEALRRAERSERNEGCREVADMPGWRAIESAPGVNDGEFLIVGMNDNGPGHPKIWDYAVVWREAGGFGMGVDEDGGSVPPFIEEITHWMALPTPPSGYNAILATQDPKVEE
ncbi:hypothetical protein SAMN05421774_10842 [Gemmobacter megaterium]|uniref:DUF551 domain-containing protein n=1 Tax=Gemmobacter megaterium TaxID=1086013 RepID=A0A1N7QAE8_9RHOB|nr:hypothetical protein [Gemmobacter megaterium]GGE24490.1 hypothetical protein GCM10011345_33080 [Gemmobacter megaterium]SIT19842.1 hypothetical protein SAMN05421774_10842 [Gemmobacter megaterium]